MADKINILLANPRGFCAGVDRAIQIVEEALSQYGKPIYVRHEVVHNQHVINDLKTKGAILLRILMMYLKDLMSFLVRMVFQKPFVKRQNHANSYRLMPLVH